MSHYETAKLSSFGATLPDEAKSGSRKFRQMMLALVVIALLAIGAVGYHLLNAPADLTPYGQRGDFFGGFLNPILTFLTFLTLLVTLGLQRTELIESRVQFTRSADALSQQNSQSSFYQLLSIHNQIVDGMSVSDPVRQENGPMQGREVFRVIYSDLRRIHRDAQKKNNGRLLERELIQRSYGKSYRSHQETLGHYFRYLYNTIHLLQRSEDHETYIKLLRAILSDQELLVLFYNVVASAPGENFRPLAVAHELFDNMPAQLLEDEHASYLESKAFGPIGYEVRRAKLLGYAPDASADENKGAIEESRSEKSPASKRAARRAMGE